MTKPPAAIVSLADSLFVALAMHQLKAEQVNAYSTEVLASMQARVARNWVEQGLEDKLILDPKESFLLRRKMQLDSSASVRKSGSSKSLR